MYGPYDMPIEQINTSTGTVTYLHHDQAGTTRLLTGSTGTVTGKCTYGAYGTPTCEGTTTTPLGYDGQYTSSDTGLIYMRARVYDPATAQFLTRDPLAALTREPYSYAGDNPLTYKDRSGLGIEEVLEGGSGIPCPWCEASEATAEALEGAYHAVKHGAEKVWSAANENEVESDEGEAFLKQRQAEAEDACEPTPPGYDPETWTKGPASRAKEPNENYYDPEGGEWHYHAPDQHHDMPHWDYKRLPGKLAPWEEIPIE
jgi:RHS repeat-associated protein